MAKVANKYAKALFDVSVDTNELEIIYEQLTTLNKAISDQVTRLTAIDSNPSQTAQQRRQFVDGVFNDFNQYIKNMLYVLADNRHLALISEICDEYQTLYNDYYNQDFAVIESTYELSEEEVQRIVQLITQKTQLSKVIVKTKINQDLIGGFRVKVGTTVLDGSVRNDLVQLQRKFSRTN